MSITVTQVQSSNDLEELALTFVVDSDITGSFSSDDRITITNSGTTFQNLGGVAGAATTFISNCNTPTESIDEASNDAALSRPLKPSTVPALSRISN